MRLFESGRGNSIQYIFEYRTGYSRLWQSVLVFLHGKQITCIFKLQDGPWGSSHHQIQYTG